MTDHSSTTRRHQAPAPPLLRVSRVNVPERGQQVTIGAGVPRIDRIVPPAGQKYAFDVVVYPHSITVYVSRTGRSVRVWIDGVETKIPKKPRSTLDGSE